MEPGCNIVAAKKLYGGSLNQLGESFKKMAWEAALRRPGASGVGFGPGVRGVVDAHQAGEIDVRVALGRAERGVTEQFLNRA